MTGRVLTFVRVDGHLVRVSTRGEGRPLLLIMGLGGNIEMWDPLERALTSRGVQTIAYDASGTGDSPPRLIPQRMHGLARQAAHVLDALGHPDADVLGVSFGGAVAQELTLANPHRVRRLVLASTTCGLGGVPGNPRGAGPAGHTAALLLARVPPPHRERPLRPGTADDEGLLRNQINARRARPPSLWGYVGQLVAGHRLDEPPVAAPHPAADPGAQRRGGPDRAPDQRPHPRPAHPERRSSRSCPTPGTCSCMEHAEAVAERIATFLGLPAQTSPAGS